MALNTDALHAASRHFGRRLALREAAQINHAQSCAFTERGDTRDQSRNPRQFFQLRCIGEEQ